LAERRATGVGTLLSRLTGRRDRPLDATDRPGEVELQAAGVRVVMIPAWGGRITALELGGRQWLAPSNPPSEDPERRALDVALAGGYEECFPTVLPCRVLSKHTGVAFEQPALGELHRLVPAVRVATLEGAVEATLDWTGDRLPYQFSRVVRASSGEIAMRYAVTNTGSIKSSVAGANFRRVSVNQAARLERCESGARSSPDCNSAKETTLRKICASFAFTQAASLGGGFFRSRIESRSVSIRKLT